MHRLQPRNTHIGKSEVPGLSGGNLNRNLCLANSLWNKAFALLVSLEGKDLDGLLAEYKRLTGATMEEDEGNLQ